MRCSLSVAVLFLSLTDRRYNAMHNGNNGAVVRTRPASSANSSTSSGSGSSKHVRCIGRYVLTGTTLGKGNFARVEAAVHTLTRSKVAVKIIETDKIKEEYVRKNLLREAQLMRRLRHPNIIRLYETMKTSNLYCLVTEVAEGGELLSHVRNDFKEKRLSEATTRPFIRQLVSALHHLHTSGIVHRDLKMENILLDRKKKQIKIVDFGLSNAQQPGSLLQTHCGSPEYAAPELFIPGREYGPEVDVWSLGVNMYAMLVGKLPFRSPRQGSKKRQKLLEQIQAGLNESKEKDMTHVTPEGRDLIGKLLQANPHQRVKLTEVMIHPWITKDGAQPLHPYKYTPPDQATQKSVMELMSTYLEVSQSEIREAVRRDRCDWMAAIYNLIMDQPDGRAVMQRLLAAGPDDQLVDAAHYQHRVQSSMEHFRLSQDTTSSETTPTDVARVITASVAMGTHSRLAYRHSIAGDQSTNYPSSTLPLKKRHHHNQEPRPPSRQPLNPVQPPPAMRRASIGTAQITPSYNFAGIDPPLPSLGREGRREGLSQTLPNAQSIDIPTSARGGNRRLPVTPSEAPYQVPIPNHHEPHRPHSRAESEPNPLPLPWRPGASILKKFKVPSDTKEGISQTPGITAQSPSSSPPPLSRPLVTDTRQGGGHHGNMITPLVSPLTQMGLSTSKKKRSGFLRPVISGGDKKISASVDANLDSRAGGGQPLGLLSFQDPSQRTLMSGGYPSSRKGSGIGGNRSQISAVGNPSNHHPMLGWTSNSRMGSLPRRSRDIQAMMQYQQPVTSPYSSVQDIHHLSADGDGGVNNRGSVTSVDIKHEMFSGDRNGRTGQYENSGTSPHGSTMVTPHGSTMVSPHGSRTVTPHGSRTVTPHGSRTVTPHGSRTVTPHGSRTVSPHGSRTVTPHESRVSSAHGGNKRLSPHGSTTISPLQSMHFSSPEGSKVISPYHSRVMEKSHENLKSDLIGGPAGGGGDILKSKRHHRSISANPMIRQESSDYYKHNVLDHGMIPNGVHLPTDHHGNSSHNHNIDYTQRPLSSTSKTRRHTHSGDSTHNNSYLTEL